MPGQDPDNMEQFLGVPEHVAELIVRYYDATLSEQQITELREALEASAAAREWFVRLGVQSQTLAESLAPAYSEADEPVSFAELAEMEDRAEVVLIDLDAHSAESAKASAMHQEDAAGLSGHDLLAVGGYVLRKALKSRPALYAYAAAVLLLAFVLLNPWASSVDPDTQPIANNTANKPAPAVSSPRGSIVATLTATNHATWAEGALAPGSPLRAGDRLTLTHGLAEITTQAGAVAILQAPATIELLDSDNALRLHSGKLVGICETESSKGLLVRTPHMDVVDLGTRFGVDASPGLGTEVHVHQGEVVVEPIATGLTPARRAHVYANQAVSSEAGSNRVAFIQPDFDAFDPALRTYRLFGTGFGLAEGEADPNWLIVADGRGPLDQPLPLIVMYGEREGNHFPARGNDPAAAQWVTEPNGYGLYRAHDRPRLDLTQMTIRSRFVLPRSVDLQHTIASFKYASGGISEIRINGQPLAIPLDGNRGGFTPDAFHRVQQSIAQTALRHGENVIEIDRPKRPIRTQAPPSFYFYAEVGPSAVYDQNHQGETQP